jgi:hypothetical protein
VVIAGEALPPPIRSRLNRLARQLKQLHDPIDRWVAGTDIARVSEIGAEPSAA